MYTIKKGNLYVKDSRYIGSVGKVSSYTNKKEYAVKYSSYDEAKKNACGNERVVIL